MKKIFLSIQGALKENVPALRYIDKNWGQLNIPQPPVKWPCCLIDLKSVDYSQLAHHDRLASADITLTVADCHAIRSAASAPSSQDAYAIFDLIEAIFATLDGHYVPGTCQPLSRTSLRKAYADASYDVFALSFATAWKDLYDEEGGTAAASPSISVIPNLLLPADAY